MNAPPLSLFWPLPVDASAHGPSLDLHLFRNLWIALGLFAFAHLLLLIGLLRSRRSEADEASVWKVEYLPLAALSLLFVFLALQAERLWAAARYTGADPAALQVEATGMQFAWYFRYPGEDATFGATEQRLVSAAEGNPVGLDPADPHGRDDVVASELVLPLGREVDLRLRAQDVIHGFAVPELRLKQNAVPGQTVHIHFTATAPGTYAILCTQPLRAGALPDERQPSGASTGRVRALDGRQRGGAMTPGTVARRKRSLLRRAVFTTDHRAIGLQYLGLALVAVGIGTGMSLAMRIHLMWPAAPLPFHGAVLPEDYLALVTLHGTIMLFFVMTTAPQAGFGNLILPAQIGSRTMAFPRLNAGSFWLTAVALLILLSSSFVQGGAAISGWTAYPPLSAVFSAGPGQALGMDLWLASIALFAIASTVSSINTLVTILKFRCEGMTWERLPLTVWGWFTAALLSVLAFSVLLAALTLLFCDRHAHTSFFVPAGDLVNGTLHSGGNGSPLLWLHLFWFFGHPEVYIAILPGMGLTSMVLANFARRRVFAYRTMIVTTLLIGFLGILVWGHHMFVAGLNPFAGTAFSISTIAIAIPATAKVLSWLATVWRSKPRLATPMLFSLGFVSLFIAGGLTGPILAQPILDQYLHNTFFVVAHFHLIMAMAGVFGLFAGTYYWFPLVFGRMMSERLGKLHFWGTFVGAYATFLPMHITGLAGEPRHYAQLTGVPGTAAARLLATGSVPLQGHITYAAIFLATMQLIFLVNLARSVRFGLPAPQNPWDATTLEWHPALASDAEDDGEPINVFRSPCAYGTSGIGSFYPQWHMDEKPE